MKIDQEWIDLILKAKKDGLSKNEIRAFLNGSSKK